MDTYFIKTLPTLAAEIRDLFNRETAVAEEWVEVKLALIARLAEARARFLSDPLFGIWLAENELDALNKDDRAAALNMAQDMQLASAVLREGRSRSFRTLWFDHMKPRMVTIAAFSHENHPPSYTLTDESVAKEEPEPLKIPEVAIQPVIPEVLPPAVEPEKKKRQMTKLEREHGVCGAVVYAWLRRGTLTPAGDAKVGFVLARLSKTAIKRLAEFVRRNADILPPARSQSAGVNLRMIWQEAPQPLLKQLMGATEERTLLNVIEAWDRVIAPVLTEWRAAGSPKDATEWYLRTRQIPTIAQPAATSLSRPAVEFDYFAAQRVRLAELAAPMKADSGLARDGHDQWPLPPPEPIRVNGLDIWPTADRRYDWPAAYYAYNLFLEVTEGMREDRSHIRARIVMNPIGPLLSHINGRVGAVWLKIASQVHNYPEQGADTFGPGKTLQGKS